MAALHPSQPFPLELDREGFAWFISGFSAGEGSFQLNRKQGNSRYRDDYFYPHAVFSITLRADDQEILKRIMSFFQCGRMTIHLHCNPLGTDGKPAYRYDVDNTDDLVHIIIPHFEKYHMHNAKKNNDFSIWKSGVLLMKRVKDRPKTLNRRGQFLSKWTKMELRRFETLKDNLRRQRRYEEWIFSKKRSRT